MQTIYKYQLEKPGTDYEVSGIPSGAKILRVDRQAHSIFLWALVDTKEFKETRFFEVRATGEEIPQDGRTRTFLNTFLINNGEYVFHAFEVSQYIQKAIK